MASLINCLPVIIQQNQQFILFSKFFSLMLEKELYFPSNYYFDFDLLD